MPITVDTLAEIKEIKLKILAYFLECVVLPPSLYMLVQLFSSISVNSEQLFTEVEVNILGFSPTLR